MIDRSICKASIVKFKIVVLLFSKKNKNKKFTCVIILNKLFDQSIKKKDTK